MKTHSYLAKVNPAGAPRHGWRPGLLSPSGRVGGRGHHGCPPVSGQVTNTSGELGRSTPCCRSSGDGEMVGRLPNVMADPTLESIRVNLNSVLDQTETAFAKF